MLVGVGDHESGFTECERENEKMSEIILVGVGDGECESNLDLWGYLISQSRWIRII